MVFSGTDAEMDSIRREVRFRSSVSVAGSGNKERLESRVAIHRAYRTSPAVHVRVLSDVAGV